MKQKGNKRFLEFAAKQPKQIKRETNVAVIYTRVSSAGQEDNASLSTQRNMCDNYAQRKGLDIIQYFGGTSESAKNDDRKEFQRMLSYVKRNKKVSYVLVYSYSRFSRSGQSGASIAADLRKRGIHVIAVTQEVDTSTPSGVFQENIFHSFSQYDNEERRRNMMNGMQTALRDGYWPLTVPLGYTNLRKGLKCHFHKIVVNEKGKILKRAWQWKIKYNLSNVEIVKRLNKAGLKINERKLSATFRNPFYCGKIVCSFIPNEVHEGQHEKMVTPEQFFKVIEILKGRFEKCKHSVATNQQLPLKRFVSCGECGSPTTGYFVKKKNLYYYKCRTKGCKKNVSQKKFHEDFKELLNRYQINPDSKGHIEKTLKYVFKLYNEDVEKGLTDYRSNLTKISNKIERLEERYVDEDISKEFFNKHHIRLSKEKEEIQEQIENSMIKSSNLEKCIEWTVDVSTKLNDMWTFEDFENSKRLQKVIFPEGITYDWGNRQFRTSRVNSFFLSIPQLKVVSGQKKAREKDIIPISLAKSGRQDSNLRPPAPKAGAITGLRYAPSLLSFKKRLAPLFLIFRSKIMASLLFKQY